MDDVAPVINLNLFGGRDTRFLTEGDNFNDLTTVTDNFDQIVLLEVDGLDELDTDREGVYILVYNAMDSSGNRAETVTLTINVEEEDEDEDDTGFDE